jgi:hypothetical protein
MLYIFYLFIYLFCYYVGAMWSCELHMAGLGWWPQMDRIYNNAINIFTFIFIDCDL